jgi:hypothetical protein
MAAQQNPSPAIRILQDLQTFLCARYWLPKADFPLCSDVFGALGLRGDDCHDFMENFSVAFSIDLTDYIWPRYHLAEEEAQDVRAVLRPFMRMAGLKTQPLNRDLVPISVDHLFQVAQRGAWFDPAAEEPQRPGLTRNISRFGARLRAGGLPRKLRR